MNISLNSKGNEETPKELKTFNPLCWSLGRYRDGNSLFVQATGDLQHLQSTIPCTVCMLWVGHMHGGTSSFASHTIRLDPIIVWVGFFLSFHGNFSIALQSEVPNLWQIWRFTVIMFLMERRKQEPGFEHPPIFFLI